MVDTLVKTYEITNFVCCEPQKLKKYLEFVLEFGLNCTVNRKL